MKIYHQTESIRIDKPVVTIGFFDGLHRGHRSLLDKMVNLAAAEKRATLVITFWPQPRSVVHPHENKSGLLTTLGEKLWLLEKMRIDYCWVIPFDMKLAALPAEDFIRNYLTAYFVPVHLVIGDDHRFGKGGAGDLSMLRQIGRTTGFQVHPVDLHLEGSHKISSSFIRSCLQSGDLASVNRLLGYPYLVTGKVITGKKVGRSLGFPTANVGLPDLAKIIPADGVYAVQVNLKGDCYNGMLNIGVRPTVDDLNHKTIEVHLFDVTQDLYGETLRIFFVRKLRDEMKFNRLDELKAQLVKDREQTMEILTDWRSEGMYYLCNK